MKPWTVILYGEAPVEAMLDHDSNKALEQACDKFSGRDVIAILPGSFKSRIILNKTRISF